MRAYLCLYAYVYIRPVCVNVCVCERETDTVLPCPTLSQHPSTFHLPNHLILPLNSTGVKPVKMAIGGTGEPCFNFSRAVWDVALDDPMAKFSIMKSILLLFVTQLLLSLAAQ